MNKLLKEIKNNSQDFEFYPTTREIIEAMYFDLVGKKYDETNYRANGKRFSILDIGAGNCKLFNTFKEIADEQPLLNEYYYPEVLNREYYENCTISKIVGLTGYRMEYITIFNDGKTTVERPLYIDQIICMLKNTKLTDIDLSDLDHKEEGYVKTNKELFLERIEEYEPEKRFRNENERKANRIFISKYMAIEKSQILIDNMPSNVFVVGTDFNENTLIDKQADIVFSNPPYSEYSLWAERIIMEANATIVYLVIPKRWGKQGNIAHAIKKRRAKVSIIGDFDFLESEDREARAKVSLVKIDLRGKVVKSRFGHHKNDKQLIDPFELWFNETFKVNAKKTETDDYQANKEKRKEHKEKVENALVKGIDLVSVLVELYNNELNTLTSNYLKVSELDADVLKELNVDVENLLKAFKSKVDGLKNLYWNEIFNNLDAITSRLTSRTRESLLKTLMANTNIDFTSGNIRSVVIWVIKNANKYYESQMLEVYDDFTTGDGILLYKSNKRFMDDTWRYNKWNDKDLEKYALDYRLVVHGYRSDYSWDREKNVLAEAQIQYLKDIIIIAKNLGFNIESIMSDITLKDKHNICFSSNFQDFYKKGTKTLNGKIEEVFFHSHLPLENGEEVMEKDGITHVYCENEESSRYQYKIITKDGYETYLFNEQIRTDVDVFTTVKGYNNGNVHFQFNRKFIKKLNLEVGRLRGWIKSPEEAANEFDISVEEANEYWNSTYVLLPSMLKNLLPNLKEVKEDLEEELVISGSEPYDKNTLETFSNGTLFEE
jgi:archaellum component FlaC